MPFWAALGGFTDATTGRGTHAGIFEAKYPEDAQKAAPAWVKENGQDCLEFDGKGTCLLLPRETLPSHGAFTLSLDVKPNNAEDQYLLTNRTVSQQTGLNLQIKDGTLHATFRDNQLKVHPMATGLKIPANNWASIKVRYDFQNMTFTVNNQSQSFPLTFPAFNIGFTLIGEAWNGKAFAGKLRNLHIVHNAL